MDGSACAPEDAGTIYRRGWYLRGDLDATWEGIHDVVMGIASQVPPQSLRLHAYDPRLRARMSVFAPLRQRHAPAFPPAISGAKEFHRVLALISHTGRSAARDGSWAGGASEAVSGDTFHVVVVLNYPEAVDARVQAELVRLAAPGGPPGVLLLVQADETGVAVDESVDPDELALFLDEVVSAPG